MIDPTYHGLMPVDELVSNMVMVRTHFKNAPAEVISALTLLVCQDFCTVTKVVTRSFTIPVYSCSAEVVIPMPEDERIVHVVSAVLGGEHLKPTHDEFGNVTSKTCYVEDNIIYFGEAPPDDTMLKLKVSVAPTPLATRVSVKLIDNHLTVIEDGVLARMYGTPSLVPLGSTRGDYSYYIQTAGQYANKYNKGLTTAMQRSILGTSRGPSRINLGRIL